MLLCPLVAQAKFFIGSSSGYSVLSSPNHQASKQSSQPAVLQFKQIHTTHMSFSSPVPAWRTKDVAFGPPPPISVHI